MVTYSNQKGEKTGVFNNLQENSVVNYGFVVNCQFIVLLVNEANH